MYIIDSAAATRMVYTCLTTTLRTGVTEGLEGLPMQAAHPTDHVTAAEHQETAVRAELERILLSPAFRGSRRCCRFLEYSVQHVLQGNAQEDLRERNIGIEVFQRSPDYDTAEDAIVRVTANEVRKRLAQFYQESGADSDPVITLPPGAYA